MKLISKFNDMRQYINNIMVSMLALVLTVGCVDTDIAEFKVDKPQTVAEMEYLNDYGALKSYINRNTSPNFKLGAGVTVSDFVQQSLVYNLMSSNFDEVTAGNAMKYSSCVDDNGAMDFSQVRSFVNVAQTGGLTIYGHTLAWHAQQRNKYLNGLIADKELEVDPDEKLEVEDAFEDYSTYTHFPYFVMGFEPQIIDGQLVSSNPAGDWIQYFVADNIPTVKGKDYKVTALIQGSADGSLNVNMGDWGGSASATLNFTTEWKEVTVNLNGVPAESCFVIFQPGTFNGDIRMKWLKVTHSEAPSINIPVIVAEYDFEDGNPIGGWGDALSRTVEDGVCVITNPVGAEFWAKQLCHETSTPFENGTTYFMRLKIKGSVGGKISAGFQNPDGYKGCGDFPAINITTDWNEITVRATCNGDNALRLLFSIGDYVGTLYMDDICIYWEKPANSIPLTPEEKKEILTAAMGNWVKGMMEACDSYVTVWDVVNEAISGRDVNGDGFYELQSAVQGTVSEDDAKNNFYWQDYLGDIDYVRTTIKLARQYFEEFGGNPADLKLFINDYNLESDWDDNKKLKSLINWIARWEEDGTKVDGIGTQMHVSCYANPDTQQSKEKHVVKMFELMAATGKLIKISELDMGYVDADGKDVATTNMTFAQHQEMAEYYNFIVRKYFETIPVAQQYGITQWCTNDSPENSSWRGGQPVGLWDLNYNRKPAYAGFADGLAGKE